MKRIENGPVAECPNSDNEYRIRPAAGLGNTPAHFGLGIAFSQIGLVHGLERDLQIDRA